MKRSTLIVGLGFVVALAACGKKNKDAPQEAPQAPEAKVPPAAQAEAKAPDSPADPQDTVSIIVVHEVANFDKWKQAFDARSGARKDAGAIWHSVSRDVENPDVVYVHIVGTDLAKAQAFVASDELAQAMSEAGVEGDPEITLANDVEAPSSRDKLEGETYSLFVTHEVADFDRWKPLYDADATTRTEAMGVLGGSMSRAVENSNRVIFHLVVGDPQKVAEGMASDEMQQKMAEAGVKGTPEVRVAKDVETSTYQ